MEHKGRLEEQGKGWDEPLSGLELCERTLVGENSLVYTTVLQSSFFLEISISSLERILNWWTVTGKVYIADVFPLPNGLSNFTPVCYCH